jgi:NAD(P)-dependent dehydrogenase (short-subunit alcohol dehydrogenase family)
MGEIALVTGGAGALGGALVRALVARGDRVAIFDGTSARTRADELAAQLGTDKVMVATGDLASLETWKNGLLAVKAAFGDVPSLAALVAGGWAGGKPLHETTDDAAFTAMMSSNAQTVHNALVSLLPSMVEKKHGSVVAIGSRAVERPWTSAKAAAYAASKAAAVSLVQVAAEEVLEHGVRINAVLPSTMDTRANRNAMPKADPTRWVALESAAKVICFLLSDDAKDISGAAIPLYGRA